MGRMKTAIAALAAATLLGAAAAASQAPPAKAYMVAQLHVTDAQAFAAYAPKVPPVIAKFGGHYIVRGGATVPLEGAPPADRIVMIEFPSLDAAQRFYRSPDYQALAAMRHAGAEGPVFIVEGVPAP